MLLFNHSDQSTYNKSEGISIHLMLLFNPEKDDQEALQEKFQYI